MKTMWGCLDMLLLMAQIVVVKMPGTASLARLFSCDQLQVEVLHVLAVQLLVSTPVHVTDIFHITKLLLKLHEVQPQVCNSVCIHTTQQKCNNETETAALTEEVHYATKTKGNAMPSLRRGISFLCKLKTEKSKISQTWTKILYKVQMREVSSVLGVTSVIRVMVRDI